MKLRGALVLSLTALLGCASEDPDSVPELTFVAVTFNTGTTAGAHHDEPPDDGYTTAEAAISDMWYGDGLAWLPVVEATRAWLAETRPDVIGFQEIFHAPDCAAIPVDAHTGFFCETWTAGAPTVTQVILGADYQIACNLGKPDKCLGVRRGFGTFRGCDADVCLDGLDGGEVAGCGSGSRIGRGVVDLVGGGSITVVNVHGTSGLTPEDTACRVRQFDQIFVDLGDGAPAANGAVNVILGDFNIDPVRYAEAEDSAARAVEHVGEGKPFHFVTETGWRAPPTYAGIVNIDHVISDVFAGSCWVAGVTDGHPPVTDIVYFDHKPIVCTLEGDRPE
jgi:hypothetical protein